MGAYEFNKATYKAYTLRMNRQSDADIITHLKGIKSINQYIAELIRGDMANSAENNLYEVIEDMGTRKDVLKGFRTLEEAISFLYMYVSQFTPAGRVYLIQRFIGIMQDGHKIRCGKVLNIEKEEN